MPKKTTMRRNKINGNGVMDVLKSIYNKAANVYDKIKTANAHLKANRYAGRLVQNFPGLTWVPAVGGLLQQAANMGYAPRRRTRKRL